MTERKPQTLNRKEITRLYREELGVQKLYQAEDETITEASGRVLSRLEGLSTQADLAAERLSQKGRLMLVGISKTPSEISGQDHEMRLSITVEGFRAKDRSVRSLAAAYTRWHT